MWLLIALVAPMFYGIANVSDSLLINKNFRNPLTLTFYASCFALIFVPIVFIFYPVSVPSISLIPIFILLGIINVLYLYPYYKGLQSDDTSTAVSFFALGRIFIPIWAFFVIGEKLSVGEYLGVGLVIVCSILLSMKGSLRKITFSKAILYILLSAFIISFEGVLLKYLFEHGVSVGTGVAGEMIFSFLCTLVLLASKKIRTDIIHSFSIFKENVPLFFIEEGATFVAFFTGSIALGMAPVTLVRGISSLTPFFVLAYAKVLGKKVPHLFNEQTNTSITLKKIIVFTITVLGVLLIAR
jgi:drug/metabolite transporter (DMT)-like permease